MPPTRRKETNRESPSPVEETTSSKKTYKSDRSYEYSGTRYGSRLNSTTTPGTISKEGLTLYPAKGNQSSNLTDWKRALTLMVSKQYPHLDEVMRNERYIPETISILSKAQEDLLSDLEKELKILDAKEQYMKNKLILRDMPIVFDIMIGLCSQDSLRDLQIHYSKGMIATATTVALPAKSWDDVLFDRDLTRLFIAINMTHRASTIGVLCLDQIAVYLNLLKVKQWAKESLSALETRIKLLAKDVINNGLPAFTDQQLAGVMFRALGDEYANMRVQIMNAEVLEPGKFPKSTSDVLKLAENWVAPAAKTKGGTDIFISIADEAAADAEEAAAVLLQKAKINEKRKLNKSRKETEVQKPDQTPKYKEDGELPSKDTKPPNKCNVCGDPNHFVFHCPDADEEEKAEAAQIYTKQRAKLSNEKAQVLFTCAFTDSSVAKYARQCTKEYAQAYQTLTEENYHLFPDCSIPMSSEDKRKLILSQSLLFPDALILDNGAQVGVVKEESFLQNITDCDPLTITGSTPGGVIMSQKGINPILGEHYYNSEFVANITSFSAQKRMGNHIAYNDEYDYFRVWNDKTNQHVDFHANNGLYTANIHTVAEKANPQRILLGSVDENKLKFSRRQVALAEKAYEFMDRRRLSLRNAISLSQSIQDMPFTALDFERAEFIFGQARSVDAGGARTFKSKTLDPDRILCADNEINMHVDITSIMDLKFLTSKGTPGGFIQMDRLLGRKKAEIEKKLRKQASQFKLNNKIVKMILSDGEGGVVQNENILNELHMRLNTEAAGSHIPEIENVQKTIKEKVRGRNATTQLKNIPKALLAIIITAIAMALNFLPTVSNVNNISPHEFLFREKPTYARHFALATEEYVEVIEPKLTGSNSTEIERTTPAIALYPTGSLRGAWRFFSLKTGALITRERWRVRPLPASAIEHLAKFEDSAEFESDVLKLESDQDFLKLTDEQTEELFPTIESTICPETPRSTYGVATHPPQMDPRNKDIMEWVEPPTPLNLLSDLEEIQMNPLAQFNIESTRGKGQARRTLRPHKPRNPYSPLLFLTRKQAQRRHGVMAIAGPIIDEITQMVVDKKVFIPVSKLDMTKAEIKNALRTNLLLDEKFKSNGEFDKHKARLVAMQFKHMSQLDAMDVTSPTVMTQNIMICASIVASEKRKARVIDVSGAFLNADFSHRKQYILLNKEIARIVVQLQPEMTKHLLPNGQMYCRLNKALYGTVEAARLWYDLVVKTLTDNGFVMNEYDKCVFNKTINGSQCTILFHVDDFLITSVSSEALDQVENIFRKAFEKITVKTGQVHSFLGMTFDFTIDGKVHITQQGYIQDLLLSNNIISKALSPATVDLHNIDPDSPYLTVEDSIEFHSIVYKLLYLAKRTRPDILLAVQFLSTRVTCATEQDMLKKDRVLQYLHDTSHLGLLLGANSPTEVIAYIDASYGVHSDRRGHTGSAISLGAGTIHSGSKKQSINTKSSCECELVGLSDGLSQVIYTRNFLISQGYDIQPATINQDNTSTINLAQNGMSNSEKTRHISIRYFFVTDRIKSGDINLRHLGTEDMIADILTKPLQGELFVRLRDLLLGYSL